MEKVKLSIEEASQIKCLLEWVEANINTNLFRIEFIEAKRNLKNAINKATRIELEKKDNFEKQTEWENKITLPFSLFE